MFVKKPHRGVCEAPKKMVHEQCGKRKSNWEWGVGEQKRGLARWSEQLQQCSADANLAT